MKHPYNFDMNRSSIRFLILVIILATTNNCGFAWFNLVNPGGCVLPTYVSTVLSDGPVAYWRVGETSGTIAFDSASSNHGTYGLAFVLGITGAIVGDTNKAFKAGIVTVPHSAALNPSTITLEAWVNPNVASGTDHGVIMKTTDNTWGDGYGFYHDTSDNAVIRFYVNVYNGGGFVSANVVNGQWQQLVGTYDGTAVRIYRNGVLAASTAFAVAINHTANVLYIGSGTGAAGVSGFTFTGGYLDEVAIYNKALTAAQIQNHYLIGSTLQTCR
jgi:hypothetical protein